MTRGQLHGWSIPVSVGLMSLVLSLILPLAQLEWAGWIYFSMAILVPLHSRYRRHRIKSKLEHAGTARVGNGGWGGN